ncbi:hypothetical protein QR680_016545 [Steinernema hermaphroditum]|uniref:RING-type E3 ubiquitin transferase n=1 Tax=Steinernema hermaphroditum TaxID=289476 RepID=A0AA39HE07_9BILA|nr:hypothetical protein QR680_016545 [Steinernema hermaphroditum]
MTPTLGAAAPHVVEVRRNRKLFDMVPWDSVMSCPACSERFAVECPPVNLGCGHALCGRCLRKGRKCPIDQSSLEVPVEEAVVNFTILRMMGLLVGRQSKQVHDHKYVDRMDGLLARIGRHFTETKTRRGGAVTSTSLSRAIQRKVLILIRTNITSPAGRLFCLRTVRSVAERILSEVLQPLTSSHSSSQIWDVLRTRRCQFLGPGTHSAVLREIHLLFDGGFPVTRKMAVRSIAAKLALDFPTVTKSAVNHLFQILYLGHLFVTVPRQGKAPLMRLKPEFFPFEVFELQHDMSLMRILLEAGLRVDKAQLSRLLYGHMKKQRHIQSIVDRLLQISDPQRKFIIPVSTLAETVRHVDDANLAKVVLLLEKLESFGYCDEPSWDVLLDAVKNVADLVDAYVAVKPDERRRAPRRH